MSGSSIGGGPRACQARDGDPGDDERSQDGDLGFTGRINARIEALRQLVNHAVATLDYSHEALTAAMGKDSAYRSYVTRVLNGEKPLSMAFVAALPDDVRRLIAKEEAEAHGHIVVQPSHGEEAVRHLVSGLLGVLAPKLPAKSGGQMKAAMRASGRERKAG